MLLHQQKLQQSGWKKRKSINSRDNISDVGNSIAPARAVTPAIAGTSVTEGHQKQLGASESLDTSNGKNASLACTPATAGTLDHSAANNGSCNCLLQTRSRDSTIASLQNPPFLTDETD
jgi:hypothetical protein